jgi:hypothetical protein
MQERILAFEKNISRRNDPANIRVEDGSLFNHESIREIPATFLEYYRGVTIRPDGMVYRGGKLLPLSFPYQHHESLYERVENRAKAIIKNRILSKPEIIEKDALWITDSWSLGYYHWMTDALPRLLAAKKEIQGATLFLPGEYRGVEYIASSLKPFNLSGVEYLEKPGFFKRITIPTHTAPTGNYNERIVNDLRRLFHEYYDTSSIPVFGDRIYISRGKAQRRKIENENECMEVLRAYRFTIVFFEELSFARQFEIAFGAKYLISNHGAGLTNILFMKPGSSVLELRMEGDSLNNCYYSLASALRIKYFYQKCAPEQEGEDAHTANLVVDAVELDNTIAGLIADGEAGSGTI